MLAAVEIAAITLLDINALITRATRRVMRNFSNSCGMIYYNYRTTDGLAAGDCSMFKQYGVCTYTTDPSILEKIFDVSSK